MRSAPPPGLGSWKGPSSIAARRDPDASPESLDLAATTRASSLHITLTVQSSDLNWSTFLRDGLIELHRRSEHARQQTDAGIQQRQGRDLAARKHEIPKADFFQFEVFDDAFVNALVVASNQQEPRFVRQLFEQPLIQRSALGGKHDSSCFPFVQLLHGAHSIVDGLAHQHHPGAAAERSVVHLAVSAGLGPIAKVMNGVFRRVGLRRSTWNAGLKDRGKHFRKERQDVKPNRRVRPGVVVHSTQASSLRPGVGSMSIFRKRSRTV